MKNKIRYYIKRPRVLLGKIKRLIFKNCNLPTITVVIPTYKEIESIKKAIKSALDQNYPKRKLKILIIVNGKEYRYYKKLLNEYKNQRNIKVEYTEVPGLHHARNFSLQFIKSKYFTLLDDDDYLTSNYLNTLLKNIEKNTKIIVGRLSDLDEEGHLNEETYINKTIEKLSIIYTYDYFSISSLFSNLNGKIYDTNFYRTLDREDNNLKHTEDVYFWVKNVNNLAVKIKLANKDSKEAYVRVLSNNSMSRPKEGLYNFYVKDRLMIIKLLERELLKEQNDLIAKRFILTKIVSQSNLILNYYNSLNNKTEKNKIMNELNKSDVLFINRSKFGLEKGIAFCHNFAPYIDASSFVASKRLSKISELSGEIINWDVISSNMSNCREKDLIYTMFFASFQYTNINILPGKAYFNEKAQYIWGEKAFKEVEDKEYKYIYSRSMWAGSHIAAYLYKQKYPNTVWYAEFSDPIYMDTNNEKRPCTEYGDEDSHLKDFWYNVESKVFKKANYIIFTNENQKNYMINYHEEPIEKIDDRSIVLNHPVIDSRYSKIINTNYYLDNSKINIGFFGNFYKNRNGKALIKFLDNPNVVIHLFTSTKDDIPENDRIIINNPVSNLEFLNIASKMTYLFLNDIDFNGEINPYLPSKLSDYLVTSTPIIALVNKNTELEKYDSNQIIKIYKITDKFVQDFKPYRSNYDTKIIDLPFYKELYTNTCLNYKEICKDILNGKVNLGFNILNNPDLYDKENNIRWEFDEELDNINTFYLYYYGLRMVYILIRNYEINDDTKSIDLAKEIVKSFYKMIKKSVVQNSMVYNDHAQSERIENIVYLYSVLEKYNIENDIQKECMYIINDALEKLMGDKYYQKNHNHGIIADKACLIGLCFLKQTDKIKSIQERLMEQINHAFNKDGVHIENSIDYHYTVVQGITFCFNLMKHKKYAIDNNFEKILNNIYDFMIYTTKPDGTRFLFGDSKGGNNPKISKQSYGNSYLEYIVTEGTRGKEPKETFKYFESGYVFTRENFKKENFKDTTCIALKAGYKTRIHKHQDDLSFCLYSKGHDIFVDPGMYNYIPKDHIKDYFESIPAHNSICIKDRPYSIASGNGDKFKILGRRTNKEYDYILCVSSVYPETLMYRNLYYIKELNIIIIQDNIYSENTNEYAQYFHLGKNVSILLQDAEKTILELDKNKKYKVYINQLNKIDNQNILSGLETKPYSLISDGFGKYINSKTLEYTKTGKNTSFITVIDIAEENDIAKIKKINKELTIMKSNKTQKISLEYQEIISESTKDIDIEYKNGQLIINNKNLNENVHCTYTFKDSKANPEKKAYTTEPVIKINCQDSKENKVMYYLKNKYGIEKHGIICYIKNEKLKKYSKFHYPKMIEHKIDFIENKYVFKVKLNYDLECSYRWFVYLNGAQVYFENNNSNIFKYEMKEAGDYVIMVSISNKYFREIDFYQFDKISKN